MTVKKECLIKSLKSDYSSLGLVTAICLVMIGVVLACTVYSDRFYIVTQYLTAFNVYVVMASIASIFLSVIIALDDYSTSDSKKGLNDKESIWLLNLINCAFVFIPWFIYVAVGATLKYPDVTIPTLLILGISIFIVSPFSLAYARCKE